MAMITCQTGITKQSVKALARYSVKERQGKSKKRLLIVAFGVFLLVLGIINAYGLWMKYRGAEPAVMILLRASLLLLLGVLMVLMGVNGPERRAYLKLKDYFSETKVTAIDYQISDEGIRLTISGEGLFYSWASMERIRFDRRYFYITSGGRHSILEKCSMDAAQTAFFERLIEKNHVPFGEA